MNHGPDYTGESSVSNAIPVIFITNNIQ